MTMITTKISIPILLSLMSTFLLRPFTLATLTSAPYTHNLHLKTEQTISQIVQWNESHSGYFTNITVSGNHWTIPAYISLSIGYCLQQGSGVHDYCWKSYLVMNNSNTNKTQTVGALYNYFDSPTLEWNKSAPILKKPEIVGYYGNETMGLSETTMVKSDVFLSLYSVQLGLGGGLSFTPDSHYLTSLQENNIIKDRVFYFHQDISTDKSGYTFNLTVGSIPADRTNIYWTERSKLNNTWELEGEYVLVGNELISECDGTVFFTDNGKIQMRQEIWASFLDHLISSKRNNNYYACDDEHLKSYPILTIYTKEVAINIPPRSYLDLSKKDYFPGEGEYCQHLFDSLYDSNSCAVLGFNVYKEQFFAFSLDKQAIGVDLNETYIVTMITNEIELIVGAVSLIMCLILAIWGNTYYYEKQAKIIEKEIADYERRPSVDSLPESDMGF